MMNKLLLAEAFNLEISTNPSLFVTRAAVRDVALSANGSWLFARTSIA